jgi:addiction module HigA family antidote
MFNPPHPGHVLRDGVIGARLGVTDLATRLGVDRVTLSRVLNGRAGISAEMALRLEKALGTSAQAWLHMQDAYDLWQAERAPGFKRQIAKIERLDEQTA